MKQPNKLFVPILVLCGIVIGGVLMYVCSSSFSRLRTTSRFQNRQNASTSTIQQAEDAPKTEELDVMRLSSATSASAYRKSDLLVKWVQPIELNREEIFKIFSGLSTDPSLLKKIIDVRSEDVNYEKGPPVELQDEYQQFTGIDRVWKQGEVVSGSLEGSSVYLVRMFGWNTGPGENIYQVVIGIDGKQMYISSPESDGQMAPSTTIGISTLLSDLKSVRLSGTSPRATLYVHGRKFTLTDPIMRRNEYIFDTTYEHPYFKKQPLIVSDEGIPLYDTETGCLAALLDSGLVVNYTSVIASQNGFEPKTGEDLGIIWNQGYQNDTKYLGKVFGGCGGGYCANVVSSTLVGDLSGLVVVGIVKGSGDQIFAPKDPINHPIVKAAYDMWFDPLPETKVSIDKMIERFKIPVFFWKDPIGRWIEYGADQLVPQAECGKPVIYLYPETKSNVKVVLPKFVNVTVSDPSYPARGWNVTAYPNGELVSKTDGKTYGSLYWEGTGVTYQSPTTGFVMSAYSVTTTLSDLLARYGLNQKESSEFMDFWLPKMAATHAPYFRVSFLTDDWSKAAPLTVSPRPQTSIRIFMDWQPLSAPISIKAPTIVTPVRDGFTLVEWGGLLYK